MVIGNNYSEMLDISIAKERGSMKLNWKSQGEGGGLQTKQPSMVKVWLFSEITGACFNMLQFTFQFLVSHFSLGLVCQA